MCWGCGFRESSVAAQSATECVRFKPEAFHSISTNRSTHTSLWQHHYLVSSLVLLINALRRAHGHQAATALLAWSCTLYIETVNKIRNLKASWLWRRAQRGNQHAHGKHKSTCDTPCTARPSGIIFVARVALRGLLFRFVCELSERRATIRLTPVATTAYRSTLQQISFYAQPTCLC